MHKTLSSKIANFRASLIVTTESSLFCKIITSLIILNAITLGMETYPVIISNYGTLLSTIDTIILCIFVIEILMRIIAHGFRFFKDPWGIFDLAVITIAFLPSNGAFSVLRAARVLRVLRLISIFPRLKHVVEGLISAIPGIGSIGAILLIIFYVFAVMATKLFSTSHPEWFGSLTYSMFSLFQIMTLEGWADMVRDISKTHSFAPAFFIIYILVATFTVLNLFIAVIVDAMQRDSKAEEQEDKKLLQELFLEIKALRKKIDSL